MRQLTRLIALLLLLGPLRLSAQSNKLVTLSVKDQPLKEVIRSIVQQTGYSVVVSDQIMNEAKNITIEVKNVSLEKALELCFKNSGLNCSVEDGIITITRKSAAINTSDKPVPASIVVSGKVTNKFGSPLGGASVTAKGKKINTTVLTDEQGVYNFVTDPNVQLTFSFVNYTSQTFKVKETSTLNVTLEFDDKPLETVTISTGYQNIQRKHLTGAVTTLKMDSMQQPGFNTIDKMLEGRVPGMTFLQNSGQAGAVPRLRIRGTSTVLGSQEPLWVVDGIVQIDPVSISPSKINDLDFVNLVGNAISGLNPNDIDQIDVLKDAAATALYGVRAANGVIVITTKRGKAGPPAITYNGSVGFQTRPRYSDRSVYMMNSRERVEVSRELIQRQLPFNGVPAGYEKAIIDYYNGDIDYNTYIKKVNEAETVNTDWFDIILRDAVKTDHTIQVSGGNQTSRYFASAGFSDEPGVIKKEFFKRYTANMGFDVSYKKFTARFALSANKSDRQYTPQSVNVLDYAYGTSRAIPLYNEDGSLYYYSMYPPDGEARLLGRPSMNVVNEMNRSSQTQDQSGYQASANIQYELFKGIKLRTALSYAATNTEREMTFEEKTNYMDRIRGAFYGIKATDPAPFGGELSTETSRMRTYMVRAEALFDRFLDNGNKHLLTATLGTELTSSKNNSLGLTRRGYYPERGNSFANIYAYEYPGYAEWTLSAAARPRISNLLSNLASLYASASYVYDDRYVFTLGGRSDYSNSFGTRSNEKFLPTWSASGKWNMHNDVLRNVKWITQLSFDLSYGTQGNILANQTPDAIIRKDAYFPLYESFFSKLVSFPNPNLKWEKTDSYNAGLDFVLFKNRINGRINYFYKRTTNTFVTQRVSELNGLGQYVVNGGVMENKGIELMFQFALINNIGASGTRRGFSWRFDPQLGQVFNQLIGAAINNRNSLLTDPQSISYQDYLDGKIPFSGKAINTFYSYRFKGLDNRGMPVFYGAELDNKDALAEKYAKMEKQDIYREVMVESGRRIPILQGGITNHLEYRNWILDLTLTYSFGNKIRLMKIASGQYSTYRPTSQQNLRREYVDRWRSPGDELYTNIPGLNGDPGVILTEPGGVSPTGIPAFASSYYQMYDNSDLRVVSGDYIKLQAISLKCILGPQTCARLFAKAASLSFSGTNLITIASKDLKGQDPTQTGMSPGIQMGIRPVYTFSVSVTF